MGLRISSLSKSYPNTIGGRHLALNDVSLEIPPGAFLTLLGPSGCGKTTLLNLLAGLDRPNAGRIEIGGSVVYDVAHNKFLPPAARNIAMVFQSYAIWPHMTVRQNVEFPIRHGAGRVRDGERIREQARDALEKVRLLDFADRPAPLLSGGQQQRVSLARALAQKPAMLLLDEPLSNLDASLREEMQREIRSIVSGEGITTVYVTHDQKEALAMSDVIAVMREGVVEQAGSPQEIYFRPRTRFVAEFVGSSNLIDGTVSGVDNGHLLVDTAIGRLNVRLNPMHPVTSGTRVTLVLKQEDFQVVNGNAHTLSDLNVLALSLVRKTFHGGRVEMCCLKNEHPLVIHTHARHAFDDRSLTVAVAPEAIHYF